VQALADISRSVLLL